MKVLNKYNFQVGDYCRHADGSLAKVVKVDGDNFACRIGNSQNLWSYNNRFEPIEITEEWLNLNFESYYPFPEYKDDKSWKSKDLRLTVSTLSNMTGRDYDVKCIRRIHLDNEFMETLGSIPACYVHHIQHLCRDCQYKFEPKFKTEIG